MAAFSRAQSRILITFFKESRGFRQDLMHKVCVDINVRGECE